MRWPFVRREDDYLDYEPYPYVEREESFRDESDFLEDGFDELLQPRERPDKEPQVDSGADARTKICPQCGAVLFADMDVCYGCLYEFGREQRASGLPSCEGSSLLPESRTERHNSATDLLDVDEVEDVAEVEDVRAAPPKARVDEMTRGTRSWRAVAEPFVEPPSFEGPPPHYCPDPQASMIAQWKVPPAPDIPPTSVYREVMREVEVRSYVASNDGPKGEAEATPRPRHLAQAPQTPDGKGKPKGKAKAGSLGLELKTSELLVRCRVPQDGLSVGRDEDNDVVLRSSRVSRHHVRIIPSVGGFTVKNCGATNCAMLNGVPVNDEARLAKGASLNVCGTKIRPVLLE